jgi:hypothetical protein
MKNYIISSRQHIRINIGGVVTTKLLVSWLDDTVLQLDTTMISSISNDPCILIRIQPTTVVSVLLHIPVSG